jgi:hypothetical protein
MEVVRERKRAILDAMPETLYRSLPSADLTAELCSTMIARAVRARNPRLVRQWVNYERTRAMDADLRASFELALDVEMAAASNLRDTDMGAMIRAEVRACFDEARSSKVCSLPSGRSIGHSASTASTYLDSPAGSRRRRNSPTIALRTSFRRR